MLTITVPGIEFFDDMNQVFINSDDFVIDLEHSLVSLSKWESIYEKPFLSSEDKTTDETMGYIRAMVLTSNLPEGVLDRLSNENMKDINAYIEAKRSATWFSDDPNAPRSREIITSELIYYWMVAFTIPLECEHWHLNRLFTLIKVCNMKNSKPKPMSRNDIATRNRELNARRRAQLGTTG